MILETIVNDDLGCAAYVIGCQAASEAWVVDPPLDVCGVERVLDRHGLTLVGVVETHTHADHVSGHGTLALEHDVPIHIHHAAAVAYPSEPLEDGVRLAAGNVELVALHTPGHRPEHTALAVVDHARADEPWFLLSGDSLFVGDVARPDLAIAGADGARALFRSLNDVILALGDGVELFPGHVAGSLCGRGMNAKASSTIGFERRFNPMLRHSSVDAFVAGATSGLAPKPPNLERIVKLNSGPLLARRSLPPRLDRAAPDPVVLLDVRDAADWAAAHVPGALHSAVAERGFGTRIGWFLDPDAEVCVLASSAGQAALAVRRLHAVGFLRVVGWLLATEVPLAGACRRLDVTVFAERGRSGAVQVLDVREPDESPPPLEGALQVPYRLLAEADLGHLARDRPVAVVCGSGIRAPVAASVLERRGFTDVQPVLGGGMADLRGPATAAAAPGSRGPSAV